MFVLYEIPTGRILNYVSEAMETEELSTLDVGDAPTGILDNFYVDAGVLVARPIPPSIPVQGPAPLEIDLSVFQAGSTVLVSDEFDDFITVTDLSDPLRLLTAGKYRVQVQQPFPHQSFIKIVEVQNA